MINKLGQYTEETLRDINNLIKEFIILFEQRNALGQPITIAELSERTTSAAALIVDRLLNLMKIPRLCGTDTLWKLLYIIDHQIPEGKNIVPEAIRQWLLGAIWTALEAQERLVVNGLTGLIVVVQQANLAQNQANDANSTAHIIEQAHKARAQICAFIRRYPSLLTFGVQTRLMDVDDSEIAKAFVESFQGTPDFVTQQAIIATQNRLRARGIIEPLKALTEVGIQAAQIINEGMSTVMEMVNNDIRSNLNANLQNSQRIEAKVTNLKGELNNNRAKISQLLKTSEQEIETYRPVLYLTIMRDTTLAPYVAGEIISAENKIDRKIKELIKQLTDRRLQAEQSRQLLTQNVREVFDQLRESKELEIHRTDDDLKRNRLGWEKDPLREAHYNAEIKRLEQELRNQRTTLDQQVLLRNNVETHMDKLASIQIALLDRLTGQLTILHERVRVQTREVFKRLVNVALASEKQIAIVEFGDRELIIGLINNLREQLAYDTQVRIAASNDLELHNALINQLGNNIVTAARRYISPNLLVAAFDEAALIANLQF